jgi:hypothetical protein
VDPFAWPFAWQSNTPQLDEIAFPSDDRQSIELLRANGSPTAELLDLLMDSMMPLNNSKKLSICD